MILVIEARRPNLYAARTMDLRAMVETRYPEAARLVSGLSVRQRSDFYSAADLLELAKGEVLFEQGRAAESVWIVLEGWVHLVRRSVFHDADPGHSVVLFTITPREGLCGLSAMESAVYTSSGVSGSVVRVLKVSGKRFQSLLLHEPRLASQVVRIVSQRLKEMATQYATMAEPVPNRIIRMILRLRAQFGESVPVTHRELAQMAWTTTESAIRTVRYLKKRGLVSGMRGMLNVTQPERLKNLLRQDHAHHQKENGHTIYTT